MPGQCLKPKGRSPWSLRYRDGGGQWSTEKQRLMPGCDERYRGESSQAVRGAAGPCADGTIREEPVGWAHLGRGTKGWVSGLEDSERLPRLWARWPETRGDFLRFFGEHLSHLHWSHEREFNGWRGQAWLRVQLCRVLAGWPWASCKPLWKEMKNEQASAHI